MRRRSTNYEIDMVNGPLLGKIIRFSATLMFTNILQLLYNAADLIVVGQLSGSLTAVAAVGATGSMVSLIVNSFIGLSAGAGVAVAQGYGTGDRVGTEKTVHTAITIALIGGIVVGAIGLAFSRAFLGWMGTSEDIIQQSTLYVRIFFVGAPFNMLFNFGAAILRATGDTKRPFYFLTVAGFVNILLNVFFVVAFHTDVAGVAFATIIAQAISAVLVLLCLTNQEGMCRLNIHKLKIHKDALRRILAIGLPACVQNSVFSISNIMIQSSINSFDIVFAGTGRAPYTAGGAAASNIEGFANLSTNAFYQAAMNFTGQNHAAGKHKRANKVLIDCLASAAIVSTVLGWLFILFGKPLLRIYIPLDEQAVSFGYTHLFVLCSVYVLCSMMDVLVGQLRGLGRSTVPMVISIVGICVFRILWIGTVFAANRTWEMLLISYPVSWLLTASAQLICYLVIQRKYVKQDAARELAEMKSD